MSWVVVALWVAACSSADQAPVFQQSVAPPGGLTADATRGMVSVADAGIPGGPTPGDAVTVDASMPSDAVPLEDIGPAEDAQPVGDAAADEDTAGLTDGTTPEDVTGDDDGQGALDTGGEEDVSPPISCLTDDDCLDLHQAEVCHAPACVEGVCELAWVDDGVACDDGDPCTTDDHCALGACVASVPFDCNDGDPCTEDSCWAGVGCVQTPLLCDDGDPCTLDDCDPQSGCVTKTINCPPSDNPCVTHQCDLFTGTCVPVQVEDLTACDDGDSCTAGDACNDGVCSGEPSCLCTSDVECLDETANPCLGVNVCDPETNTCVPDPDTAVVCPAATDGCHVNTCDPSTGACVAVTFEDGTLCAEPGPCDASATCEAGECVTTPLVCDDSDVCTVDSCDEETGECVFEVVAGVPCDDGDACTAGETCSDAGTCAGGESVCECQTDDDCLEGYDVCKGIPSCSEDHTCEVDESTALQCAGPVSECTEEVCSAEAGGCVVVDIVAGAACDAGPCNQEGACLLGDCMAFPIDCGDGDPCTADSCDDNAGGCINAPETGTACDDGNDCTGEDLCDMGVCVSGPSICQCEVDADCVAGWDYCTGLPTCDVTTNTCETVPNTAPDCSGPADACVKYGCKAQDGTCYVENVADGEPCDDDDPCSVDDVCEAGSCTPGQPDDCDDGDLCTDDSCESGAGCVHTPVDCEDDTVCTHDACVDGVGCKSEPISCPDPGVPCFAASCDASDGCGETVVADGVGCSDGDACTQSDTCQDGACLGTPQDCDDAFECTTDGCVDGDCIYGKQPTGFACDDANACTDGDACDDGVCVGVIKVCDDGEMCTKNLCEDGECVFPAVVQPMVCDDGDQCTAADHCDDGACVGDAVVPDACDDDDACTVDVCTGNACIHEAIPGCGPNYSNCEGVVPGGGCNDGDSETSADICLNGYCQGFRAHELSVDLWGVGVDLALDVEAQYVGYGQGSWYTTVYAEGGLGGDWIDGAAIVRIDDPDDPDLLWDTSQDALFTGIHDRVAVDDDGQVWWLQSGNWSKDTKLAEAFDDDGTPPLSAVTSLTKNKDLRVWLMGEPQGGGIYAFTRVCSLDLKGSGNLDNASCNSLDWPWDYWSRPAGVAAVSTCSDCLDALVVAGSNQPYGGGQYYNDTVESSDGTSHWGTGFFDPGQDYHEIRDVTGYGDGQFLVAGTNGHMRHRNTGGGWSDDLSTNGGGIVQGMTSRDLTGAWAGSDAVVLSAFKHSGPGGDALELWTCPQDVSPRTGSNWTIHTLLDDPGGNDPVLNDVWGLSDGTIVAVGSARLEEAWVPTRRAVIFVRSPAP